MEFGDTPHLANNNPCPGCGAELVLDTIVVHLPQREKLVAYSYGCTNDLEDCGLFHTSWFSEIEDARRDIDDTLEAMRQGE